MGAENSKITVATSQREVRVASSMIPESHIEMKKHMDGENVPTIIIESHGSTQNFNIGGTVFIKTLARNPHQQNLAIIVKINFDSYDEKAAKDHINHLYEIFKCKNYFISMFKVIGSKYASEYTTFFTEHLRLLATYNDHPKTLQYALSPTYTTVTFSSITFEFYEADIMHESHNVKNNTNIKNITTIIFNLGDKTYDDSRDNFIKTLKTLNIADGIQSTNIIIKGTCTCGHVGVINEIYDALIQKRQLLASITLISNQKNADEWEKKAELLIKTKVSEYIKLQSYLMTEKNAVAVFINFRKYLKRLYASQTTVEFVISKISIGNMSNLSGNKVEFRFSVEDAYLSNNLLLIKVKYDHSTYKKLNDNIPQDMKYSSTPPMSNIDYSTNTFAFPQEAQFIKKHDSIIIHLFATEEITGSEFGVDYKWSHDIVINGNYPLLNSDTVQH